MKKQKKGDIESFEKIILEYEKLYFNIAFRILGDIEDAKDATQNALIKIYNNLDKCLNYDVFKTWSCKIVTNTAIDLLRMQKRKSAESLDEKIELEEGFVNKEIKSDAATPEEIYFAKERNRIIKESINKLELKYKTIIILRDINGFSYEEISKIINQPIGTVKSRISRARNNLRVVLSEMLEHKNIKSV